MLVTTSAVGLRRAAMMRFLGGAQWIACCPAGAPKVESLAGRFFEWAVHEDPALNNLLAFAHLIHTNPTLLLSKLLTSETRLGERPKNSVSFWLLLKQLFSALQTESGITEFEEQCLAHIVLPNGNTLATGQERL